MSHSARCAVSRWFWWQLLSSFRNASSFVPLAEQYRLVSVFFRSQNATTLYTSVDCITLLLHAKLCPLSRFSLLLVECYVQVNTFVTVERKRQCLGFVLLLLHKHMLLSWELGMSAPVVREKSIPVATQTEWAA